MFRALGARLTLDNKGVAGVALFEAAAQRTWLWGTSGLKTATELFAEGELQEDGLSVSAVRCDAATERCVASPCTDPMHGIRRHSGCTTVDIVRTGDAVEIGVSVEQDMRHHRVPPSPLHPPLVALLHDLVADGATAGIAARALHRGAGDRHRSDRCLRAVVPARPRPASPGRALQRDQGGGRRVPGRCRRPGAHRARAVRARARLRHAARRGLASTDQTAAHAVRVRRRRAHLLAALPAHRPAAAPSAPPAPAPQHRERPGDHPPRRRGRRALLPSTGRHRDAARNPLARARAGAHRGDHERSRPGPAGIAAPRRVAARHRCQRHARARDGHAPPSADARHRPERRSRGRAGGASGAGPESSTELTGHPASSLREAAAPETTDINT